MKSPLNNSTIRSLIHFKYNREKGLIYAVYCALQMTFVTICISWEYVGWLSKEAYHDESS